ncbi:MAG: sulfite exporter TauE/SafE family protein [Anaerolineales bacterium]|nr:sulfite exporter TauE/SafE family protein [Anaerolineales bacterium]
MEINLALVGAVLFLASFTQSLSGFGVALISMALLPSLMSIQSATALVALIGIVVDFGVLARYRKSLKIREVWPLILASFFGVPLGIFLLSYVKEQVMLVALGFVLVGYAIYALVGFKLPALKEKIWAYLAGFLSGLLGGAYNTNGPPIIIYASCRRWPPDVFKGNLQSFFLVNSLIIVAGHAISGNFTPDIWTMFLAGLPGIALGLLAGISLDKKINPYVFRKIVLVLLLVMGVKMVV